MVHSLVSTVHSDVINYMHICINFLRPFVNVRLQFVLKNWKIVCYVVVIKHDDMNSAQRTEDSNGTLHFKAALPGLSISCRTAILYFCYQFHEQSAILHVCVCVCVCVQCEVSELHSR